MRKTTVEIDKVTGTSWPPESVESGGKTHTLESIYADAGMELEVLRDQADLEVPASGPVFDLASLHEFMTTHRKPERDGWHAHIVIVPHIEYFEGWKLITPLGVMYDLRSADLNNRPREGCAVSARAIGDNELVYLRTLAHELGHVFNLLHPKEENPPLPVDTTVMNQTGDLLPDFPDNIEFRFHDGNKAWLAQAPAEFVMPGGEPFTARPEDVGTLSRDETYVTTPGLTLEISTQSPDFELGEPVYLRATLRNDGKVPLEVDSTLSISAGTLDVRIISPENRESRFRPAFISCSDAQVMLLEPGKEILASEPIFFGALGRSFKASGPYRIRARYQTSVRGQPLGAVARRHTIEVRPCQGKNLGVADALAAPGPSLYLTLRGGAHLRGAEETLSRIVRESPQHSAAQYARIALATQVLSRQSADAGEALQLLKGVASEKLNRTQRAEHHRLGCLANARLGDTKAMDAEMKSFEKLAMESHPGGENVVKETAHWLEAVRTGTQQQ